jgi:hypothetical protein
VSSPTQSHLSKLPSSFDKQWQEVTLTLSCVRTWTFEHLSRQTNRTGTMGCWGSFPRPYEAFGCRFLTPIGELAMHNGCIRSENAIYFTFSSIVMGSSVANDHMQRHLVTRRVARWILECRVTVLKPRERLVRGSPR